MDKELIDRYRYINVEDSDWSIPIVEDFIGRMAAVGVHINDLRDVYYSISYSQGDGASFTAHVSVVEFIQNGLADVYPVTSMLLTHGVQPWCDVYINSASSAYSHSGTMLATLAIDIPSNVLSHAGDCDTRIAALDALDNACDHEVAKLEQHILDRCRAYADDLYTTLRDGYECLTSDTTVWETILANELN